ncbi:sigma-54 interaction domain-containing protein [Thermosediminibacter litoriperuensis]|uniref:PAS domain S-box-containing protein n=1 Tax=Thermosediminibacter litoriperuensis TaxID=291989 RepID=A0A5S5AXH9_9FIRM|nr:sigma 54-interacting transcriptional regulator [Thermosediminibacter litoriperuensis]TYP58574.1 PAS domain S-box-containing protein [Thermosediminibacter litoriperuensis]
MISSLKGEAEYVINLLKNIIEMIPDAVMVADRDGNCIMVNQAYKNLSGLSEEDVVGKPADIDIAERDSVLIKSIQEGREFVNLLRRVGPDKREVLCSAKPIYIQGELVGSVGVMHDISEIKRMSRELEYKNRMLRSLESKYTLDDILGNSEKIMKAKEEARACAGVSATVLLVGESGTGKELFAHAIHNMSPRAGGPFVRVNCAAINKELVESELFGYEGGSFTGSLRHGKKGYFEQADGGTLFLDEISEFSLSAQAKLLRVLQEQEVLRIGSTVPQKVDVRVIAATNRDLEEEVRRGNFRQDLYYRLNVIKITIPPLRERKGDIPLLCSSIIKRYNQKYGRGINSISKKALEILMSYDWPGNVRELENIISRAMINMDISEKEIKPEHLPDLVDNHGSFRQLSDGDIVVSVKGKTWDQVKREFEAEVLKFFLKKKKSKTEIARDLGITRRALYKKMKLLED